MHLNLKDTGLRNYFRNIGPDHLKVNWENIFFYFGAWIDFTIVLPIKVNRNMFS